VAGKIPSAKIGSVEVRPVMVFDQPLPLSADGRHEVAGLAAQAQGLDNLDIPTILKVSCVSYPVSRPGMCLV
jgi:hypothetical protein